MNNETINTQDTNPQDSTPQNYSRMPFVAIGFSLLPILLIFFARIYVSSGTLIIILLSPVAGFVAGIVALRDKGRISTLGKVLSIIAIVIPLIIVLLIIILFIGVATNQIPFM